MSQFGLPETLDCRWARMGHQGTACMTSMIKFYIGPNATAGVVGQHWAIEGAGVADATSGGLPSGLQFWYATSELVARQLYIEFSPPYTNGNNVLPPGGIKLYYAGSQQYSNGQQNSYVSQIAPMSTYNANLIGPTPPSAPSYSLPTLTSAAYLTESVGTTLSSPASYKQGNLLPFVLYTANASSAQGGNAGQGMVPTAGPNGTGTVTWSPTLATNYIVMQGANGAALPTQIWMCPGTTGTIGANPPQISNATQTMWIAPANGAAPFVNTTAPIGYVLAPNTEYEVYAQFLVQKSANVSSTSGDFLRINLSECFGAAALPNNPSVAASATSEVLDGRSVAATVLVPGTIGGGTAATNGKAMNFWVPMTGSFRTGNFTTSQTGAGTGIVTKAMATTDLLRIMTTLDQTDRTDTNKSVAQYTVAMMRLTIRQIGGWGTTSVF